MGIGKGNLDSERACEMPRPARTGSRLEEASSASEPVVGTGIGIYMYRDLPGTTAPSSARSRRKKRRGPR
jgi:hypothetical protein